MSNQTSPENQEKLSQLSKEELVEIILTQKKLIEAPKQEIEKLKVNRDLNSKISSNSRGTNEKKEIFVRLTAWLTGITALLTAIAAVLGAFGEIDFTSLLNILDLDQIPMKIIDSEYAVLEEASVWRNTDISKPPIERLEVGNYVHVRGLLIDHGLYAIELTSKKLGYVSIEHLTEADIFRAEKTAEIKRQEFLFRIRVSSNWENDVNIYKEPDERSKRIGILTAGKKIDQNTFNNGEAEVIERIADGKWLEIGVGQRSIGFVYSQDVTEIWPTGVITYTDSEEEITATLKPRAAVETKMRQGSNYLRIETKVKCEEEACNQISLYSGVEKKPNGPRTYKGHRIIGNWQKGDEIPIYAILPLEFIDLVGNNIYYCIGTASSCRPGKILRVSASGIVSI